MALISLLQQTVRPDRVILWLEAGERARLPPAVTRLVARGLEIRECEDGLRPYKKIVPALETFPEAYIATADDDCLYPPDWLSGLVGAVGSAREILCYRGHWIKRDADDNPKPYKEWERISRRLESSFELLPTGVEGVLYPPAASPGPSCGAT